jgi:hypothetical protein
MSDEDYDERAQRERRQNEEERHERLKRPPACGVLRKLRTQRLANRAFSSAGVLIHPVHAAAFE